MSPINRRELLIGSAAAAAAVGLAACSSDSTQAAMSTTTQMASTGKDAPFDTVVVLMMENRSFDHLLGWLPGAGGSQDGVSLKDSAGASAKSWHIGDDAQGCTYADPKHDFKSVLAQINGGAMDGFMNTGPAGDTFPISYYEKADLPVLAALAENYSTFSNYYCSFAGPTWPNRLYQHCATSDLNYTGLFPGLAGNDEPFHPLAERPSGLELAIWDRIKAAGLTGKYYFHTEPMTGLFKSGKYDKISHRYDQFLTDAKTGKLPNVSFVDPNYGLMAELTGTSNDMHPHGSVVVGDAFVAEVYEALRKSPQWDRMVFVLNFDEHGGFYDTVKPPKAVDDTDNGPEDKADYQTLGVRVPAIAISPFAPKQIVTDGPYEHCSVLKMIEWRWDLEPMTKRDAHARNLADALDFSKPRDAIELPKYADPDPVECPAKVAPTTLPAT